MLSQPSIYKTLEDVQSDFTTTKYDNAEVIWDTKPHVLVLANAPPEVKYLSADRFKVYLINDEDPKNPELLRDFDVHKQLAEIAKEQRIAQKEARDRIRKAQEEDEAEEAAASSQKSTRAMFDECYGLKPGERIRSNEMMLILKAVGCGFKNFGEMDEWIKVAFKDELAAGKVKKVAPKHLQHWEGFDRKY